MMPMNKPVKQPIKQQIENSCKIKMKKTHSGKEIQFEGKCSPEQVEIAKENLREDSESF